MPTTFRIPGSLKKWFDGSSEAECFGRTIGQCIYELEEKFPNSRGRLLDENKDPANILIFLNGDNVMKLSGLETPVQDGDEVGIIPLAAGG